MNSKIVLILMSTPEKSPYLDYYTFYLNKMGINYDMIIWDRDNSYSNEKIPNVFVYKKYSNLQKSHFAKFIDMIGFGHYVKSILKKNQYKKLILFTIQSSFFLSQSLLNYKRKYIIDVRDYSPLLKLGLFNKLFNKLTSKSFSTVLSSPNFIKFVTSENIYISHNIHPQSLFNTKRGQFNFKFPIKILTIGQIRDYESNQALIHSLGNNKNYNLIFSGKGNAVNALENYVKQTQIENIEFTGSYNKSEEDKIVESCDIINSFMPDNFNSLNLLSNRLYLCVRIGKPIIVNSNSIQGEIVKKYNLGIAIDNTINLTDILNTYLSNFNSEKFNQGRIQFMSVIKEDYLKFEKMLSLFAKEI